MDVIVLSESEAELSLDEKDKIRELDWDVEDAVFATVTHIKRQVIATKKFLETECGQAALKSTFVSTVPLLQEKELRIVSALGFSKNDIDTALSTQVSYVIESQLIGKLPTFKDFGVGKLEIQIIKQMLKNLQQGQDGHGENPSISPEEFARIYNVPESYFSSGKKFVATEESTVKINPSTGSVKRKRPDEDQENMAPHAEIESSSQRKRAALGARPRLNDVVFKMVDIAPLPKIPPPSPSVSSLPKSLKSRTGSIKKSKDRFGTKFFGRDATWRRRFHHWFYKQRQH